MFPTLLSSLGNLITSLQIDCKEKTSCARSKVSLGVIWLVSVLPLHHLRAGLHYSGEVHRS